MVLGLMNFSIVRRFNRTENDTATKSGSSSIVFNVELLGLAIAVSLPNKQNVVF